MHSTIHKPTIHTNWSTLAVLVALSITGTLLPLFVLAPTQAGAAELAWTHRISLGSTGAQPTSSSATPVVSADGRYIAFTSFAANLVTGDTNGTQDVFVRDTLAATTRRVSVSESGTQLPRQSSQPSISEDGTAVAFTYEGKIGVWRSSTGRTTWYSSTCAGCSGATDPQLTANGERVVWQTHRDVSLSSCTIRQAGVITSSTNTVTVPTWGRCDLSRGSTGWQSATQPSISDTGSVTVAAVQGAYDYRSGTYAGVCQAYGLSVLGSGSTGPLTRPWTIPPASPTPSECRSGGTDAAVSGDGRYVVYVNADAIMRYGPLDASPRVETIVPSQPGGWPASAPSVSENGAVVVWATAASSLAAADTNGTTDVFAKDIRTGQVVRVSNASAGVAANAASAEPMISDDGCVVTFQSAASNLVAGDTNTAADVFSHRLPFGTCRNRVPTALADSYTVPPGLGATLQVAAPGVLANDSDPDGPGLTAQLLTGPGHGSLNLAANGSFSYTPEMGYSGTDTFTYRAIDAVGAGSSTASVTLTVPTPVGTVATSTTEIEDALHNVTSSPGPDTIQLLPGATYELTSGPLVASGEVVIQGNGATITSSGNNRVLDVPSASTVTLNDVTLTDGTADVGGAIYNDGSLTLIDTDVTNSEAQIGGAISGGGNLVIDGSSFTGNTASLGGGAIATWGTTVVRNTSFTSNEADLIGGAIASIRPGTMRIEHTEVVGNVSALLGGGLATNGTMTIVDSSIADNHAVEGGGIYHLDTTGIVVLEGSTIRANTLENCAGNGSVRATATDDSDKTC